MNEIDFNNKVVVIAEAGVNHNGSIELAKELIDVAVDCNADYVKFQTFKAKTLVTKKLEKANYQKKASEKDESQFEMIKKLELDLQSHKELIQYCQFKNIEFLSTPFDLESVEMLDDLGMKCYKIPSGEITNLPYLRAIGSKNKKVILSTGMSNMKEVKEALRVLVCSGTDKQNIIILHANTEYPTPFLDVNLRAMQSISEECGVCVGYSDHTSGIEVPIAAVAMGAIVIEKHFTKDKSLPGPDHKASLEPEELKLMIKSIRNIEAALGHNIKKASPSEMKNIPIVRKSLVAARDIKEGEVFTLDNLCCKRPGTGLSPMDWDLVIGTSAKRNFSEDDLIEV